jgi:hypothetical protein
MAGLGEETVRNFVNAGRFERHPFRIGSSCV